MSEQSASRAAAAGHIVDRASAGGPEPVDWLLLLLALRDAREALDPVRVQAGMFLLGQGGQLPSGQAYAFEAADPGPFARGILTDLERLVDEGLLEREAAAGFRWSRYRVSARGLHRAQQLVDALSPPEIEALRALAEIKERLASHSMSEVLSDVRRADPAQSRNSIFG